MDVDVGIVRVLASARIFIVGFAISRSNGVESNDDADDLLSSAARTADQRSDSKGSVAALGSTRNQRAAISAVVRWEDVRDSRRL